LRRHAAVVLLLLTGFFFRTFQLPSVPSGLTWDEGAEGLETLDLFRGHFPAFFPQHGGHEPLLIYLQAGALKVLGWSPFALRLPNAFLTTLALAASFTAARALFGWRVAWLATLLQAVALWQETESRMAIRPATLILFGALAVYWLVRWLRGQGGWRSAALCGVSLGVAQYSYTSARFLVLLVGAAVLAALLRQRQRQQIAGQTSLAAVAVAVVFAPLGAYFLGHPEAFSERARELSIFNPANGPALSSWLNSVKATLLMFSFAGEQGWDKNIAHQPLFDPVLSLLFVAGLAIAIRGIRQGRHQLALAWLVIMATPLTLTARDLPDFGRAVGIAPAVFLFPAIAAAALWRRWAAARWAIAAAAVAFAGFSGWQYFGVWEQSPGREQVYRPGVLEAAQSAAGQLLAPNAPARVYFGTREPFDAVEDFVVTGLDVEHPELANRLLGYDARYTQVLPPTGSESYLIVAGRPAVGALPPVGTQAPVQLGDAVELRGYQLPTTVAPGRQLTFDVQWQPRTAPPALTFFAHLLDFSQQRRVVGFDHNGFPADEWRGGETVWSSFPLDMPANTQPGAYWLEFGAYLADGQRLQTSQGGDRLLLGPVVAAAGPSSATPQAELGGQVGLLPPNLRRTAGGLDVDLTWLPVRKPDQDYSVFVHVLDAAGKLVAQDDGPPDGGSWPARYWLPGVAVPDAHHVTLPSLGAGVYRVSTGLYRPDTGQRLASSTPGPEPDSILAGQVTVP